MLNFQPIPIFLKDSFAEYHLVHRSPTEQAVEQYLTQIFRLNAQCKKILDIGAGTGHFAVPLALHLPEADIVALEPSQAMASKIQYRIENDNISNIRIINGTLSSVTDDGYDLIFLSEVIHLFEDKSTLIKHLITLLSQNGILAIRTPSHLQLEQRHWYKNFPTAKIVDLERHPSISYLKALFELSKFRSEVTVIDESRPITYEKYLEMLTNGSYSAMSFVPESEFEQGVSTLKQEFKEKKKIMFDYKMTLILSQKTK